MKKIRKIKKTTAVISAAAIFAAMTSCGSTEAPKPAEEKQSAATTQSAITEQETQPIIEDTANDGRETIGFERTADNEITTADGKFTISKPSFPRTEAHLQLPKALPIIRAKRLCLIYVRA